MVFSHFWFLTRRLILPAPQTIVIPLVPTAAPAPVVAAPVPQQIVISPAPPVSQQVVLTTQQVTGDASSLTRLNMVMMAIVFIVTQLMSNPTTLAFLCL
jgi:hypothetical protein